jgi:hypothetical protein
MTHEIVNQTLVILNLLGSLAVGDPSSLHDGAIIPHVINHTNEAVIQNRELVPEDIIQSRDSDTLDGVLGVDFTGQDSFPFG